MALFLILPLHTKAQEVEQLSTNFYKHFTGTLAGQSVQLELWSVNGNIDGRYVYTKYRKPISLRVLSQQGNQLKLCENGQTNTNHQDCPIWEVTLKGTTLSGTWNSGDRSKTYKIQLTENYLAGVTKFGYRFYQQKVKLHPEQADTPSNKLRFSYPEAIGENWINEKINKAIQEQFNESLLPRNHPRFTLTSQGITEIQQFLAKDYRQAVGGMAADFQSSYAADWRNTVKATIGYNAHNYVQIKFFSQGYFGGAHGSYHTEVLNMNTYNGEELRLRDVTMMDTLQFQKLLERQFRKQRNISKNTPLNTILFENHLAISKNFAVYGNGIEFIYNPYEVAGFAAGPISIFLPYEDFRSTLNPEFKHKMQLAIPKIVRRNPKESTVDFVQNQYPNWPVVTKQVIATKAFGTTQKAVIGFFKRPYCYNGAQNGYNLVGFLWLSVGDHNYREIRIGKIYQEGGMPHILAIFFANVDQDVERELAVLVKWPQRHYDYGGAFYGTKIFDYDRAQHQFIYLSKLSNQFSGCECRFRDGRVETSKYKTAAAVRGKLKKMGF